MIKALLNLETIISFLFKVVIGLALYQVHEYLAYAYAFYVLENFINVMRKVFAMQEMLKSLGAEKIANGAYKINGKKKTRESVQVSKSDESE